MESNSDKATGKAIVTAVVIAGLSALTTRFVEWGIERLRSRFKKPDDK